MIKIVKCGIITILLSLFFAISANAESLFTLGASQTYSPIPKSLYGGVQARAVGDLISIILDETINVSNNVTYNSAKESNTIDNFTPFWNKVFDKLFGKTIDRTVSTFGGHNEVNNTGASVNSLRFTDRIAVQVIQQMPNGNLVVQGKKTLVNANEREDLVVSGVVDPRWITANGEVYSRNVANLQFAFVGRGSVSRSNNDGIVNKFIRYLF